MKIIKKLSPIMESISNVGKDKKKMLDEEFDINHPIGVLPHADAVAMEQHIADRAAGLERRANPDKDPLVKELIDETASEKSRTLHYDVVDRKGLAKILTEAKKNKQKFKVGKSDKLGYRYFVDIFPIYGSQGALDVVEDDAEGDEVDGGEMLGESLNKGEACFKKQDGVPGYLVNDAGKEKFLRNYTEEQIEDLGFKIKKNITEDIEKEIKDYIKWCEDNKKEAKDYKSLENYLNQSKLLKEAKYKTPVNDSEDYINAMYKAYKELSKRKGGYAAVYGYRKGKTFVPFLALKDSQEDLKKLSDSLKTRDKGQNDVIVYTLFKDNLEGAKELLKNKGLLKENLSIYNLLDDELEEPIDNNLDEETEIIYQVSLISYPDIEETEEFDNQEDAIKYAKENQADYDEVVVEKITTNYIDREDRETIYEGGKELDHDENKDLDEDLQLYASSLKDFKPAKEAEELWDEIIEKGKLDDLEYELENVFKADDDENASIDIEGLNDLLVNHQDFIRTLIGLDEAPLEDDDYNEEPVGDNEMVYYEDDEEPVDEDAPLEREDDDIDYREIGDVDDSYIDDEEPIDYEDKKPSKWKKIDSDEKEIPEDEEEKKEEEEKPESKEEDKEEKKEEKIEESLDKKEPEIKLDDEENLEEYDKNLKEYDSFKDDALTENIANSFIKNKFTEAKDMSNMSDEEKRQELARKSLQSLNESDEEVIDINDKELTEALGMPTEDQVKKEEPKVEQPKPEEVKEEPKENKNEEIK